MSRKIEESNRLYFSFKTLSNLLGIKESSAKVVVNRLVKRGVLLRLKRDLYVLGKKWAGLGQEEFFSLANMIQVPSYISFSTALGFYEATTQIQQLFFESVSVYRSKKIKAGGVVFNYVKIRKDLFFGFIRRGGVFIATPEKALLDSFYLISLGKYRIDFSSLNPRKFNKDRLKKNAKKFPSSTLKLLKNYGYL